MAWGTLPGECGLAPFYAFPTMKQEPTGEQCENRRYCKERPMGKAIKRLQVWPDGEFQAATQEIHFA